MKRNADGKYIIPQGREALIDVLLIAAVVGVYGFAIGLWLQ